MGDHCESASVCNSSHTRRLGGRLGAEPLVRLSQYRRTVSNVLPRTSASDEVERLARVDWGFEHETSRDLTHGLHPWPAKFIPQIPRAVIETCAQPGDRILDPFVGCGTTAVEALRHGCVPVVSDVNPLAALITQAKCDVPTKSERELITQWAEDLPQASTNDVVDKLVPAIPNIQYWFDDDVIAQLSVLREATRKFNMARSFLDVVFSSIILSASHQESETRYRRVERVVTAATVLARFRSRLEQALAMAASFELDVPPVAELPEIACADAREWVPQSGSCDVAVFSPPYPNSFDYHLYHRFRMFWLGFDPRVVKHQEIGAHLRYLDEETWRRDMRASLGRVADQLREDALCVVVVGDGVIAGETVPSSRILGEEASELGFREELDVKRPVSSTRKAFNLSDARLRAEHVVVLRR